MGASKIYCGTTFLNENELDSNLKNHKIALEYYEISSNNTKNNYGIEIVKREYKEEQLYIETESMENITRSRNKIGEIIEMLKRYKVTPIALNYIMEDLQTKK